MASALRSSLAKLTSISSKTTIFASSNVSVKQIIAPQFASRGLSLNRTFACISSAHRGFRNLDDIKQRHSVCKHRMIQTEADGKLVEFLNAEISDERKVGSQPVSKVEGWDTKTDGTGVTLTKTFKDETITVEFDVNDSVNDEPVYSEEAEDKGSNMVARPPFEVQITKKSGRKLTFMCEFNEPEPSFEEAGGQDEDIEDQFNIIEVRVDEASKEGMDNFYTHNSTVMDGTLYDLLMDMLDERGIDDTFINNMVDFATSYEHNQYVDFLEKLSTIIKEK